MVLISTDRTSKKMGIRSLHLQLGQCHKAWGEGVIRGWFSLVSKGSGIGDGGGVSRFAHLCVVYHSGGVAMGYSCAVAWCEFCLASCSACVSAAGITGDYAWHWLTLVLRVLRPTLLPCDL